MTTLNVIGCGRVGRALAQLCASHGAFEILDVFDIAREHAESAVAFIGCGCVAGEIDGMRGADAWMLTPPDDRIVASCEALAATGLLRPGDVVFHCSGASPSRDLAAASARGAVVASVHPLKSFADSAVAARTFEGTYCAAEGDAAALAVLRPAFERIGARVSEIDAAFKTVYHAASVIVCNYLAALLETGIRSYEKSGFKRDDALRMMEPLVRETVDNVFTLGTAAALTGPIARGDHAVVARQVAALEAWDSRVAAIYKDLGVVAVELARTQGKADTSALTAIGQLLSAGR